MICPFCLAPTLTSKSAQIADERTQARASTLGTAHQMVVVKEWTCSGTGPGLDMPPGKYTQWRCKRCRFDPIFRTSLEGI